MLPLQMLRVALGLMAVFFAAALGRVTVRLRRQKQPFSKALTWVLRVTLCVAAVFWKSGFDAVSITTLSLVIAAFAGGAIFEQRPRHEEETHLFHD